MKTVRDMVDSVLTSHFDFRPEELQGNPSLRDSLGLDSLDAADMLAQLEIALKTKIEIEDLGGVTHLNHIYDLAAQHMAA